MQMRRHGAIVTQDVTPRQQYIISINNKIGFTIEVCFVRRTLSLFCCLSASVLQSLCMQPTIFLC